MGQKVNPLGFRLGKIYPWKSRWFIEPKNYKNVLLEDIKLRRFLEEKLRLAGLVDIEIERSINKVTIILSVSRPGVVIGRGGKNIEELKKAIIRQLKIETGKKGAKLELKIEEVKNPDLSARLICDFIIDRLIKRYPHRRVVSSTMERVMNAGAAGVKIVLSGRIAGTEIGRTERYFRGTIPAQTLRADIDYFQKPALTKFGYIGVKIWINRKKDVTTQKTKVS